MKKYVLTFIFSFLFLFGARDSFALTVSPAKLEINGDPGSVLSGVINLYNEQADSETFYTSFENFEPGDEGGTPHFIGAADGLATWMKTQQASVTLESQERAEVPFTITIPADAEAGGYFSALFFGNQPPAQEGQVSIGGRIGVLILLRVNGDIPETGGITEFNIRDKQMFYTIPPVNFEYKFANTGGDRVVPKGDVVIKNMFGSEAGTFNANPIDGSVLPGSARKFKLLWGEEENTASDFLSVIKKQIKDFRFGYYTAHLNLGWGFTNQTAHESISFLVIPWQLLLVGIALLVLLFSFMKFILSSYKKSILKELQKQQNIQLSSEKIPEEISETKESILEPSLSVEGTDAPGVDQVIPDLLIAEQEVPNVLEQEVQILEINQEASESTEEIK